MTAYLPSVNSQTNHTEHTVEVRWFFRASLPQLDALPTAPARTDWYAPPAHDGCNIKLREGRMETKICVAEHGVQQLGAARGRIEEWVKWEATAEIAPNKTILRAGQFQPVTKRRHTQIYRLSGGHAIEVEEDGDEDSEAENRCQFEYSAIDLEGSGRWWTVSFEAVGDDRNRVLGVVAKYVIAQYHLLLTGQRSYGYPQFIRTAQDL